MRRLPLLSLVLGFSALAAFAAEPAKCPDLRGRFACALGPEDFSWLDVDQSASGGVTTYEFRWSKLGGDADSFRASASGERDEFGYVTYCRDDRLVSVAAFDPGPSEILADRGKLERRHGGRIVLSCPRDTGSR
jgi:hypothetical protein